MQLFFFHTSALVPPGLLLAKSVHRVINNLISTNYETADQSKFLGYVEINVQDFCPTVIRVYAGSMEAT